MHKPISIIKENAEIQSLMPYNYKMALILGGLMTPSLTTESNLYEAITKISYIGDNRVENKNKIMNIVSENLENFRKIYRPIIYNTPGLTLENGVVMRNQKLTKMIPLLPDWINQHTEIDQMDAKERSEMIKELLLIKISEISKQQIIHTLKTTNIWKIMKYTTAKIIKSFK
jgi:Mitochondrial matrix Mmp37.